MYNAYINIIYLV